MSVIPKNEQELKFYDLWKRYVPKRFHEDEERCQILADLIKFSLLTYAVPNFKFNTLGQYNHLFNNPISRKGHST